MSPQGLHLLPSPGCGVDNPEVIVGRNATLRLSIGTARLLYRGVLGLSVYGNRSELPENVRNYIERRRAMLGCQASPIDLRALPASEMDGFAQRSLANHVRRIAMKSASADSVTLGLNPAVRIRFLATLIEVYRLVSQSLPVDLTLPPPIPLSLTRHEWRLIELERARLRAESDGAASKARHAMIEAIASALPMARDELIHRQISVFAG